MTPEEYTTFKQQFWEWFDTLPRPMKERFWYYKEDMAETNFFFSAYNNQDVGRPDGR